MMLTISSNRTLMCLLFALLQNSSVHAQQVGEYPLETVTVDQGIYYCSTPELVARTLDMSRRQFEEGHPIITLNGCGWTSTDLRAVMTCIRTYNNGLTETDILKIEILQESVHGGTVIGLLYAIGQERLIRAIG